MFRTFTLTVAAAAAFLIPAAGSAQVNVVDRLAPDQPPLVMATLGAEGFYLEGGYPELSLAAIEHAIAIGADWIYLSVHLTKDCQYVVRYNPTLNPTTNVEEVFPDGPPGIAGPVDGIRSDAISDYTLAEIQQLRLTDGLDGGEHRVPVLGDALALIDGQTLVTVNLQAYDRDGLLAVLEAHGTDNLVLATKMDERWLQEVSSITGVKVSVNLSYARDPVAYLERRAETFGPALVVGGTRVLSQLTPALVASADDLGVRLEIWQGAADEFLDTGDSSHWKKALDRGATVFMTAHPTALLELLGR